MANPRIASIRAAQHTTRELKQLFAKLGTEEHPRGQIRAAYNNARRALRDVTGRVTGPMAQFEAQEVLGGLRRDVADAARTTLNAAAELGRVQAEAEAAAWGIPMGNANQDMDLALSGWLGPLDAQIAYALMVLGMGGDIALVLGDDTRQGALRHSELTSLGAGILAGMAAAMMAALQLEQTREPWSKQAIAGIDERTTDCCLRVHGQIVPMSGRFTLTGTPRYADHMEWSPFHDWCRTSIAMIPTAMPEDDLTAQMRDAARAEIDAREETGQRPEIHPSHARSRRG